MNKTLSFLPLFALTLCSCTATHPGASAGAAKRGMTKGEVKTALGIPSYKYAIDQQETWVYKKGNPAVDKAKSTALNMIPVVGPLLSLAANFKPGIVAAKSAVTFGKDEKVARVEEIKGAAPAKVEKTGAKR